MRSLEERKPRLAKAHSSYVVDLYIRLGWVVKTEFRVAGDDEPYEYILEWPHDTDPVRPELPKN